MVSTVEYRFRLSDSLRHVCDSGQLVTGLPTHVSSQSRSLRCCGGFAVRVLRLSWSASRVHTGTYHRLALTGVVILLGTLMRVEGDEGYAHAVVATDHPAASKAGLTVLKHGGNVVDAAVAASFALSVVRPASCGIGGGGFMVIWDAETQQATALDYRETAPAAANREMFSASVTIGTESGSVRGGQAVGVPGTVAGLTFAARRYGSLPLKKLIAPAIRLAAEGVEVDEHDRQVQQQVLSTIRKHTKYKTEYAPLIRLYLNHGVRWKTGDRFHSPQLPLLRLLADHGRNAFYRGEVADAIVREVTRHGGILSADDLSSFEPGVRKPVRGRFRGCTILSMPPPSSGGIALIQTLQTLKQWEVRSRSSLRDLGHNSAEYVHVVTEAMKHAFADRSRFLGDADFVTVPVKTLLSNEHAARTASRIDGSQTGAAHTYGKFFSNDDSGTSHISVIDAQGNAAACTETINLRYGSFVVVPECGIVLNNEMDDFSARPGQPNAFGLLQSEANSIQPGKRPVSSMAPTIAVRDGRALFASGASGGPRIISATVQVTLNHLVFEMPPGQAVAAPRFHHQWYPDVLRLESGFSEPVRISLQQKGHRLESILRSGVNQSVSGFGSDLHGASDPRKYGRPAGF